MYSADLESILIRFALVVMTLVKLCPVDLPLLLVT